jgi:hypothetical protein
MKKIMSLLTVFTMISNSALAGVVTENNSDLHSKMISKVFNEFRYKMTVEFDPKDPEFQQKTVLNFKQNISKIQELGVTPSEINDYMRETLLDVTARADYDRLMSSIDLNKVSGEEAGNIAMNFMTKRYQQGANYSGGQASYKGILIVVGVVIVGVATYFLVKYHQGIKSKTVTETLTNTNTETNTDTVTDTITDTDTVTESYTETVTNTCTYTGPY